MNTIDIILAALLLFGLIRGFFKGFFVEVTTLVALALGLYGAIHFSYFAAGFIEPRVSWPLNYVETASFAVTFLVVVVLLFLLGRVLTKLAEAASLGILNKLMGGVFGMLKIGLVLSVLLIVFDHVNRTIPFFTDEKKETSVLYKPVKSLVPLVFPSIFKERADEDGINSNPLK